MKKVFKAQMQVVRFGAEDVIATSGKTLTVSNMGDGVAKNGVYGFAGKTYTLDSEESLAGFMNAFTSFGYTNATTMYNGQNNTRVSTVGSIEITNAEGVGSKRWNGTYVYDGTRFVKQ